MVYKFLFSLLFLYLISSHIYAQSIESQKNKGIEKRVSIAPASVFNMFREAGMEPVNHELTEAEKDNVEKAFSNLPPLHQKILKEHLYSISFMDNMPNTALTSPVETSDSTKLFNITFRAGILNETISEWATWKENTYFDQSENSEFEITIDAGSLEAIQYVLLHEATHVVDAVLEVTPHPENINAFVEPAPFTKNIWHKMNMPTEKFINPLLETTRFRSGKTVPVAQAPEVYDALQQSPFVSLYGMASWYEDLAELMSIYHLTDQMSQPFRISVKKSNIEVVYFEPMKNKLVNKRLKHIKKFYR